MADHQTIPRRASIDLAAPTDFLALGEPDAGMPLQQWLHTALLDAMRDGRLPVGSRLPPSRGLAQAHGISRSTVTAVYERLLADGYLVGQVGRGTFVAPQRSGPEPTRSKGAVIKASLSRRGAAMAEAGAELRGCTRLFQTFEPDQIDLGLMPVGIWQVLTAKRAQLHEARLLQDGMPLLGYTPLRERLAELLATTRGQRCDPGRIVIVGSVAQATDLLGRLLLDLGDKAWVEDPGPPGAQALLAAAGASPVHLPVDEQGLRVDEGLRLAPEARLAYLTADVQMPLGHALSAARRAALLRWAARSQACVIAEERDGDFIFGGPSPSAPPAPAADEDDWLIRIGNLSFNVSPGLKLAYMVLPERLVDPMRALIGLTGAMASVFDQAVLHDFIAQGHWARHLRLAREVYGARSALLREQLDKHFGRWIEMPPQQRGLSLVLKLRADVPDTEVAARAAQGGVIVQPLSPLCRQQHPPLNGLRLGFAAFSEASIRGGVEKLVAALDRRHAAADIASNPQRRQSDELFGRALRAAKKYG